MDDQSEEISARSEEISARSLTVCRWVHSGTKSKYGDMDITADGAMEFFTSRRKVTTKWSMRGTLTGDRANFDATAMGKL